MKKTKAKRKYTKRTSKPFTCVIHGAGIDIDIKLDGANSLDKLTAALLGSLPKVAVRKVEMDAPTPMAEIPFDVAVQIAADSSMETLQTMREAITMELAKRAMAASETNHVDERAATGHA